MSTITLTYAGETITLPGALYWSDEFTWGSVVHTPQRALEGGLYIQVHKRIAGRPITLTPYAETDDWLSRGTLDKLLDWVNNPQCEMLLSYRGKSYNVVWRHQEGEVLTAIPVVHYDDTQLNDWFQATFKLMEV